MLNLLTRLLPAARLSPRHSPVHEGADRAGAAAAPSRHGRDAGAPSGCGWFDSSHELLTGLVVCEGIIVVDNIVATPS